MQVFVVCVAFHPQSTRVMKAFLDKNKAAEYALEQCTIAQRIYGKERLIDKPELAQSEGYYVCWANSEDLIWVQEVAYDPTSSLESTRDARDGYG